MFFALNSITGPCKTQEICDIVVSLYPFLIVYCPDKYIALKIIPDLLVTKK